MTHDSEQKLLSISPRNDHLLQQVCPTHPRGCVLNQVSVQSYLQFFQVVWICVQIKARSAYESKNPQKLNLQMFGKQRYLHIM